MDCVLQLDTAEYPLRQLVQAALGHDDLEHLHHLEPEQLIDSVKPLRGPPSCEQQLRRVEKLRHACTERRWSVSQSSPWWRGM